jgi:hypothetical protein
MGSLAHPQRRLGARGILYACKLTCRADSNGVAPIFRDDIARCSDTMSFRVRCLLPENILQLATGRQYLDLLFMRRAR